MSTDFALEQATEKAQQLYPGRTIRKENELVDNVPQSLSPYGAIMGNVIQSLMQNASAKAYEEREAHLTMVLWRIRSALEHGKEDEALKIVVNVTRGTLCGEG